MRLQPIPRFLLTHSATHNYGAKTQNDAGQDSYASSRELSRVLFQPSSKLVKTKDNNEKQLSAVMFFDCRNSLPKDATFALGDQIVKTGGQTYEIVGGTEPVYDGAHYEVELL